MIFLLQTALTNMNRNAGIGFDKFQSTQFRQGLM